MSQSYSRITDKSSKPSEEEMTDFIGKSVKKAWADLRRFIEEQYDIMPEILFGGAKYGWGIRYRKGGKTLCTLTPEKGVFTVLIVLGKQESEKALAMQDELSPKMYKLISETKQLHDGRWLWIRVSNSNDIDDLRRLLLLKRKPKKPEVS